MPSERIQRQIDTLLDEAEAAVRTSDWKAVRNRAEAALAFDPENADARSAGKAVGGEILVSSLLRQLVESSVGAAMFGEPRTVELKGLAGSHTIYTVRL